MAVKVKSAVVATCVAVMFGLLTACPTPGRADVISIFNLSGNFGLPQPNGGFQNFFNLTGSITVDTTTGLIQSQTVLPSQGPSLPATFTQGFDAIAQDYFMSIDGTIRGALILFDSPSLVDYTGGNLGSLANPTAGGRVSTYGAQLLPNGIVLQSGVATLVPVPEPGSTALLLTGVGALLLSAKLRARPGNRQSAGR